MRLRELERMTDCPIKCLKKIQTEKKKHRIPLIFFRCRAEVALVAQQRITKL